MTPFESDYFAAIRSLKTLFDMPSQTAVRTVAPVIRVKRDAIYVIPKLDGNSSQEFVRLNLETAVTDITALSRSSNSGQNSLVRLQFNAVHELAMPNGHLPDPFAWPSENLVRNSAPAPAFFAKLFGRATFRIGSSARLCPA